MKYNHWIKEIKRMFIPRPSKEENKRFDMAVRIFSFPKEYFSKFMDTIVQEDFITYPSYAEYDSLKDDIAKYNNVNMNNVYLSTGSGACIKSLCEITMNVESNVVSPVPCYPMYGIYGRLFGGKHIGVEYDDSTTFNAHKLDNVDCASQALGLAPLSLLHVKKSLFTLAHSLPMTLAALHSSTEVGGEFDIFTLLIKNNYDINMFGNEKIIIR